MPPKQNQTRKTINLFSWAIIAVSLAACSFEESIFETVVSTGTINGYVEYDTDLFDGTNDLEPVSGAQVYISYDSEELSVKKVKVKVETDSNGKFTATVPAISNQITYTVRVLKYFEENYTDTSDENVSGYYEEMSQNVNLSEGEVEYVSFTLDNPTKF